MANSYRVILTNDVCFAKRAVTFRDERHLDWWQVGKEVFKHFTSQSCHRCGENHPDSAYVMTDVERGEPGANDNVYWRGVFPPRLGEEKHPELPL